MDLPVMEKMTTPIKVKKIKELIGKTFVKIEGAIGGDEIVFTTKRGKQYKFYHAQDCCESVTVEDICGDINDLIGSPLTVAEETSSHTNPPGVNIASEYQDSFTWTFYRFATVKGLVTIRWYGSSNGYYSERVAFIKIN